MIAPTKSVPDRKSFQTCHAVFLQMLPIIQRDAAYRLRHLKGDDRSDAIQEVIANAFVAFVRLVERGKADIAYPRVLAQYGVAQFYAGRRVGTRINTRDVFSKVAQSKRGFKVERLDRFNRREGEWQEAVVEDYRTPIPDQAAFRIDFPRWLRTLSKRERRIVQALCTGEKTGHVARMFSVSPARISQIRIELREAWNAFHGELDGQECAAAAATA